MTRKVHLSIGRLTLHGYGPAERVRFTAALEREVERLAAGGAGAWERHGGVALGRLDAGSMPHGAGPEDAASRVAGALGRALGGGAGRISDV
jgi:hypothetical protein